MNQYHIYEKIGKGKHSTVYKGRKKKTIQYHAIKSVDKSQKPRVLQEVRTMHALDHKNILKFFAWYETTNHLWLILEYCVGGDLMSLLRQDVRLPEASVHDFGRDMVTALQFLHAHSTICCDIKPSNVLLDENGRLKLGGFGLSRRLSDINKTSVANLPPAKRGTPAYMAPELFSEGATHSTASDLWSLGCVLHECASGAPPFMHSSFNQLVQQILSKEPAPIAGASPEFSALLARLLDKNPATRIKWPELVVHPFWKAKLPLLPLPPEPALEAFIASHRLAPSREGAAAADEAVRSLRASVDLSRLSRIALSNLEKDESAADYTAAQPATAGGDITIDSADAELDFEEGPPDGSGGGGAGAGGEDDGAGSSSDGGSGSDAGRAAKQHAGSMAAGGRAAGQQATVVGPAAAAGSSGSRPSSGGGGSGSGGGSADAATVTMFQQQQPPSAASGLGYAPPSLTGAAAAAAAGSGDDAGARAASLAALLWHASDAAVKPIVANRRIERLPEPVWDAALLDFAPLSLEAMLECGQAALECFLTSVYRTVASGAHVKSKINLLCYFESLCSDTAAANVLINSSLTVLFVRLLRSAKVPALRARLASVLGLLVRHATFIAEELAATRLVGILAEALSDGNERVRRRVMATLGELLFYVATQQQDGGAASVDDTSQAWGIGPDTIAAVCRLLRPGEDEVTTHYAAKTIENICSQGGEWAGMFARQDVLAGLVGVFTSSATENVKATAASTLSRLLRGSPELMPHLLQRWGVQLLLQAMSDSSSKVQVAGTNLLNVALLLQCSANSSSDGGGDNGVLLGPQLASLEGELLASLAGLLDHSLPLLRAKALVTVMLLCRLSPAWLLKCCQHKLILHMERLARDKDAYTQDAVALLRLELSAAVKVICANIDACLADLYEDDPQQQQQRRRRTSGGGGSSASGSDNSLLRSALDYLFVVLTLVTSPTFRPAVVDEQLLTSLAGYLTAATSDDAVSQLSQDGEQGMVGFRASLLQVLEAVSQPEYMSALPGAFLDHLMPALCAAIVSSSAALSDTRFFCLRIMSDCLAIFLTSQEQQQQPDGDAATGGSSSGSLASSRSSSGGGRAAAGRSSSAGGRDAAVAAALDVLLREHVVPLVPVLLSQDEPMPLYALKLLGGILEVDGRCVDVVEQLALSATFFEFLALEHPNNNVHNIRLCRQLVAAGCLSPQQLLELGAADKVCAVLAYAQQNNVEPFLEPVLLLAHAMMARDAAEAVGARGGRRGQLLQAFQPQLPYFADLCLHTEPAVAVAAGQCLAQLAAAFPDSTGCQLMSSEGVGMLAAALQGTSLEDARGPAAVALQQQLLCAVNAALGAHTPSSSSSAAASGELRQLLGVLRGLEEASEDSGVSAAAAAAADAIQRVPAAATR